MNARSAAARHLSDASEVVVDETIVDDEIDADAPASTPDQDPAVDPERVAVEEAGLSDREQSILAFERQWWRHAGAKEQAIRDTFQLSATRYYQLLNGLLDNPAALAADPMLVKRLRRLRQARARSRRS